MKKKASLLISGITTVAMLAVAVGSFAAWDTLQQDNTSNLFTAKSGSPVELAVTFTPDTSNPEQTLVPDGSITDGTNDVSSKVVGSFTPTLTNNKGAKIGVSDGDIVVTKSDGNTDVTSMCDVSIYKTAEGDVADKTSLESGTEYKVSLKLRDTVTKDNADSIKNETLSVKLTVKATKTA